jgi:hypothetical protein
MAKVFLPENSHKSSTQSLIALIALYYPLPRIDETAPPKLGIAPVLVFAVAVAKD